MVDPDSLEKRLVILRKHRSHFAAQNEMRILMAFKRLEM